MKIKHSIDAIIRSRDDDTEHEFDEMVGQMAGKIMEKIEPDAEDVDDGVYDDIKDIIGDHLVDWYKKGDQLNKPAKPVKSSKKKR